MIRPNSSSSRPIVCVFLWLIALLVSVPFRTDRRIVGVNEDHILTERPLSSNTQEQITPSNAATNGNNNTKLPLTLPADGFPRVVIAGPCSGSSATMDFTRKILQAHGYGVPYGGEPILQKHEEIISVAKERLKATMNREPTMNEILAEGIVYRTEMVTENNNIYLFKIKVVNKVILKTLEKLGAKFAFTYRGNLLDRAICTSRDCFDKGKLGHQVYENGTDADACFDRRKHSDEKLMANFNDSEVLFSEMERWKEDTRKVIHDQSNLWDPAEIATYEDLFKFEYTDSEQVFDDSVKKWNAFLKNFAEIQEPILRGVLETFRNSRPPPAPFKETLYNFDKLEEILNESHFKEYLSH